MKFRNAKEELKSMSNMIRHHRKNSKDPLFKNKITSQSLMAQLSRQFRHYHVAYCLLRGRTLEQIEHNSKTELNQYLIDSYKSNIEKLENDPSLYVIVNPSGLTKQQGMVQAAHAVAQFLIDNQSHNWKNGRLIILTCNTEQWHQFLSDKNFIPFKEPDLNNNITAIATLNGALTKGLTLFTV